jgi:hypothetical protein
MRWATWRAESTPEYVLLITRVSRADLLRALSLLLGGQKGTASFDAELRKRVIAQVNSQQWAPDARDALEEVEVLAAEGLPTARPTFPSAAQK